MMHRVPDNTGFRLAFLSCVEGGVIIRAVLSVEVLRTYTWGTRRTQQPHMAALFQRMASREVCPASWM